MISSNCLFLILIDKVSHNCKLTTKLASITKLELLFKEVSVRPVLMIGSRPLTLLGTCLSKKQPHFYQIAMASLLVPPPSVRGQETLDHEAFRVTLKNVPYILLSSSNLNSFRGRLKEFLLKLPKFKAVQPSETFKGKSIVHLDPRKVKNISDALKEDIVWDETYKETELELTYENWPCDEILRAILPENIEVPSSYSLIGHILHMNLRDEQLPYKNLIAQVFLDKVPSSKTVVNKLDHIDNTYRNFAMEILAGEENTVVCVKESNRTYHFDFAKVYWNPRLGTEHAALVEFLKPGDVLYDVFAGVGPFAIPAAKKGVRVLANDLNPESYKWLVKNGEANKVTKKLFAFNKDGRDFLRDEVKRDILERRDQNASGSEHMSMNLPALAVEFLDVFSDWLSAEEIEKVCTKPPTIHVYCFIKIGKDEDLQASTRRLVEEKLDAKLSTETLKAIHHVRNVAPNKEMMRVSFLLTRDILKGEEPAKKKSKLANDNLDDNFSGNNGEEKPEDTEKSENQAEREKCIQSCRSTF